MTATSIRRESIRAGRVYVQRHGEALVIVGVDARHLTGERGVARYTTELLRALAAEYPEDRWELFVPGRSDLPVLDELCAYPNVAARRHRLPGRALFGAAATTGRPRLDHLLSDRVDGIWVPAPAPVAISRDVPLMLTVHDLSFASRPGDFTAYERLWHRLARPRELARRAQRLIVPAAPIAGELSARWGVDHDRIRVVEEGISGPVGESDVPRTLRHFGLSAGDYVLTVGALEPRKAPDLLVRAYVRARAQGFQPLLVIVGEGRLASQLGAPGVRLLGRVDDAELDALYAGALALVVSSLLEGYCLPVREALARGTPAVVSDLPVFGRRLAPALLRYPTGDEGALVEALLRVAREPGLRERLAAAAVDAVAGVSWEHAARATHAVLAEAVTASPAGVLAASPAKPSPRERAL
jgi:glycosyltransferase involved in cell wall biosynthesis